MSILAKMLQKNNENSPETGQIPPGLLKSVARSGAAGRKRGLYLLIVCGGLMAVVSGYFLLAYLQTLSPLSLKATPVPPLPRIAAAPVAPVQAVASSTRIPVTSLGKPVKETVVPRKHGESAAPVTMHKKNSPSIRVARAFKRTEAPQRSEKKESTSPRAKSHPKDRLTVDAYLFAARNAETKRDYLLALQQYLKAQEADPANYRIMNNVASTFLQLGMPGEALSFAVKALSQKGNYVSAMVNAGIAYGKLGNKAAARNMLTRAVDVDPANPQALFNLALSQERSGMTDEAITTYRRLANGGDSQGYLGMARIQEKNGNTGEALRLYRDILALPEGAYAVREVARKRISQLE